MLEKHGNAYRAVAVAMPTFFECPCLAQTTSCLHVNIQGIRRELVCLVGIGKQSDRRGMLVPGSAALSCTAIVCIAFALGYFVAVLPSSTNLYA